MLRLFQGIALIEGVTTLLLFLVAMPAKYLFGDPSLVPPVGMAHGAAWLIYMAAMLPALRDKGAGAAGWTRTTLAALVPFGTFINAPYLDRLGTRRPYGAR